MNTETTRTNADSKIENYEFRSIVRITSSAFRVSRGARGPPAPLVSIVDIAATPVPRNHSPCREDLLVREPKEPNIDDRLPVRTSVRTPRTIPAWSRLL